MSRDDDPDETEGRRLYWAQADTLVHSQVSMAKRKVMLSHKHKMAEIIEFGERLIITEDLDPVYVALYEAKLHPQQMCRLLLAYFCFYHLGAAAALSEYKDDHFWDLMENAAANEIPPNMNGDWPDDRWPRGSERRHFRGTKCLDAVRQLRKIASGMIGRSPEVIVKQLSRPKRKIVLSELMGQVQGWSMFGPWIAFKVADIFERVLETPIEFPNDLTLFYDEPRKALDMLVLPAEQANLTLLQHFYQLKAPPRYERPCNIQEVETVCCKWKSSTKGKYWVGKDIHEVRHALKGWGKTADKLYACMPKEVERGLFV